MSRSRHIWHLSEVKRQVEVSRHFKLREMRLAGWKVKSPILAENNFGLLQNLVNGRREENINPRPIELVLIVQLMLVVLEEEAIKGTRRSYLREANHNW